MPEGVEMRFGPGRSCNGSLRVWACLQKMPAQNPAASQAIRHQAQAVARDAAHPDRDSHHADFYKLRYTNTSSGCFSSNHQLSHRSLLLQVLSRPSAIIATSRAVMWSVIHLLNNNKIYYYCVYYFTFSLNCIWGTLLYFHTLTWSRITKQIFIHQGTRKYGCSKAAGFLRRPHPLRIEFHEKRTDHVDDLFNFQIQIQHSDGRRHKNEAASSSRSSADVIFLLDHSRKS
jgi:hypothetical protein